MTLFDDHPEVASAAWHQHNKLVQYGRREAWPLVRRVEAVTSQAREHLAGPLLNDPELAPVRDALLRALLGAGAVAVDDHV